MSRPLHIFIKIFEIDTVLTSFKWISQLTKSAEIVHPRTCAPNSFLFDYNYGCYRYHTHPEKQTSLFAIPNEQDIARSLAHPIGQLGYIIIASYYM